MPRSRSRVIAKPVTMTMVMITGLANHMRT